MFGRSELDDIIREAAGPRATEPFSLGNLVSLALHDLDGGRGVAVITDVDHRGRRVPGGHRWTALGDGHLLRARPAGSTPADADRRESQRMAVAAVRASIDELARVRRAGIQAGAAGRTAADRNAVIRSVLAAHGSPLFAARPYVPRPEPGGYPVSLDWHWGRLGPDARTAVDTTLRATIADQLEGFARRSPDIAADRRTAFLAFVRHLRCDGIRVLERIYPVSPGASNPRPRPVPTSVP